MRKVLTHTLPALLAAGTGLLFVISTSTTLTSCSDFQKALKSDSIAYKFDVAERYYLKGEYERTLPLWEELIALTRGSSLSEKVYYYHAKSVFGMKDYTLASYYLTNFTKTFPTSTYAEESAFLSAFCYYKNSPNYELDQTDTREAVNDLQLFLVRYPNSILKDSCNLLIDRLRGKLELKQFNNARQYYRLRNYQGTSVAFRNFLKAWPNTEFREESLFTILKADHHLAFNSVESKKKQRIEEAIRSYHNFADAFPESIDKREAARLYGQLVQALEQSQPTDTP